MDISDNIIIISNYIYNLGLLLDGDKESEENETNLKTGIMISESNIVINLLITNIQISLLFSSDLILSIEIDTKLMYNSDHNKRLSFFHLAFDFWYEYVLMS